MGVNKWLLRVLALTLGVHVPLAGAAVLHRTTQVDGVTVDYEVVLPNGYDASRAYPAILAFGPGPQTAELDQRIIAATFGNQAEKRGYIVVMPAAPEGQLFFQGGERIIPQFLRQILASYRIRGGKFRAAGLSNGGISAFEVASLYPQYFISITAFPGYLFFPTAAHIAAISGMCIHMFVGQYDELGFDKPMQQEAAEFRSRGMALTYRVEKGQSHRIETLSGPGAARLFDQFDQDQHGCVTDR
jgi:poly(3-hydroxybutyrate) depolymerase